MSRSACSACGASFALASRLGSRELLRFAKHVGFEGDKAAWEKAHSANVARFVRLPRLVGCHICYSFCLSESVAFIGSRHVFFVRFAAFGSCKEYSFMVRRYHWPPAGCDLAQFSRMLSDPEGLCYCDNAALQARNGETCATPAPTAPLDGREYPKQEPPCTVTVLFEEVVH